MPEAFTLRILLVALAGSLLVMAWLAARWLEGRRLRRLEPRLPGARTAGGGPAIIYFWGDYCLDCARQKRALEELVGRRPGVEVIPVRAIEEPELSRHYLVFTLPATVLLGEGRVRAVHRGYVPAERLLGQLDGAEGRRLRTA